MYYYYQPNNSQLLSQVYADAHVKRAAIFAGMCQLEKCQEEFERAVAIKPDHPDIYIQRARVGLLMVINYTGCYGNNRYPLNQRM